MSKIEGQIRIPSGCAIAAVLSREGRLMTGETIIESMKPMHDRSNGLGGGFAAYGIYPEYRDFLRCTCFWRIAPPERTVRLSCGRRWRSSARSVSPHGKRLPLRMSR